MSQELNTSFSPVNRDESCFSDDMTCPEATLITSPLVIPSNKHTEPITEINQDDPESVVRV